MADDTTSKHMIEFGANTKGVEKAYEELLRLNKAMGDYGKQTPKAFEFVNRKVNYQLSKTGEMFAKVTSVYKTEAGHVYTALYKVDSAGKVLEPTFKKGDLSAQSFGQSMQALATRALKTIPIWLALRFSVTSILGLFKSGIRFLIDWEKQMAKIKLVGTGTAEQYQTLSRQLLELGAAYGATLSEIGEAAALWRQQGRALEEIAPLMGTTIKLSLLTGRSMKLSVEDITAITKNYGIEAQNTGVILDKLTKVMLNHAVTTDVLVTALKQAGPTAATFGLSMEKLLGLITATAVATRYSGEQIGRAWRTMFARITSSAKETIQNVARVPVYMDDLGKSTFKQTPYLRSLEDIIDDLALSYSTLTSTQKSAINEAVAGRRKVTELQAAFNAYDEGVTATIEAITAHGDAERAVQVILDTTAQKMERVNNTWKKFVDGSTDISGLRRSLDGIISLLDNFDYLLRNVAERQAVALNVGFKEAQDTLSGMESTLKATAQASQLLNTYLERRVELLNRGYAEDSTQVQKITEYINLLVTKMQALPGGFSLIDQTFDQMANTVTDIDKNIADKIQLVAARRKANEEIKKLEDDLIRNWSVLVEKFKDQVKDFGLVAGQSPLTANLEDLEKRLNRIQKISANWRGPGEVGNVYSNRLDEEAGLLQKIIEFRRMRNELIAEAEERAKKELAIQADLARDEAERSQRSVVVVQDLEDQLKIIEAQKALKESELDIIDRQIAAYEEAFEFLDDTKQEELKKLEVQKEKLEAERAYQKIIDDEGTVLANLSRFGASELDVERERLNLMRQRQAGLDTIAQQEEKIARLLQAQEKDVLRKIMDHEINLLKIQGAREEDLLSMQAALEKQQLGYVSINTALEQRIAMEERITKEKTLQNNLSDRAIKLYEIAQKYGPEVAKKLGDVLSGKTSISQLTGGARLNDRGRSVSQIERLLRANFSGEYQQAAAREYFYQGRGRNIDIPERAVTQQLNVQAKMPVELNIHASLKSMWEETKNQIKAELDNPQSDLAKIFIKLFERH